MKYKILFLSLVSILLLFVGCEKSCNVKAPKNLKPIDWENYNDVYTVYWNYVSLEWKSNQEDEGKTIKVSGWSPWWYDLFYLCDYAKYVDNTVRPDAIPTILIICDLPGFKEKLNTCDLTKKCFVKGKLSFHVNEMGFCNKVVPVIEVIDINDIYFE